MIAVIVIVIVVLLCITVVAVVVVRNRPNERGSADMESAAGVTAGKKDTNASNDKFVKNESPAVAVAPVRRGSMKRLFPVGVVKSPVRGRWFDPNDVYDPPPTWGEWDETDLSPEPARQEWDEDAEYMPAVMPVLSPVPAHRKPHNDNDDDVGHDTARSPHMSLAQHRTLPSIAPVLPWQDDALDNVTMC